MNFCAYKVAGAVSLFAGVCHSLPVIGMAIKYDHPENWAANLGLTNIFVLGMPSALHYFTSLAFAALCSVIYIWAGIYAMVKPHAIISEVEKFESWWKS